jgi:hypothetical protein
MNRETPAREGGAALAAVTRDIARLHAAHYGKGPTRREATSTATRCPA